MHSSQSHLDLIHIFGSSLSLALLSIHMVIHVRVFSSLWPSPFTSFSSCRRCYSSFSSSSPTRSSWQTCTTPLRRVSTPATSSLLSGVEGGKGFCYRVKEKASVRHETSAVSCMRATIVRKNRKPKPSRLLSHQLTRGRSVSRKRSVRGKCNHDAFDNRADIIWMALARDRLVNSGILPSVNLTKQKRAAKPGISVCFRIIGLTNNRTKKTKHRYFQKRKRERRQECSD